MNTYKCHGTHMHLSAHTHTCMLIQSHLLIHTSFIQVNSIKAVCMERNDLKVHTHTDFTDSYQNFTQCFNLFIFYLKYNIKIIKRNKKNTNDYILVLYFAEPGIFNLSKVNRIYP